MPQASGQIGGYLYSSNIAQRGATIGTINGVMNGTNANAVETFRGFMDTDERQAIIRGVMGGMTDITNEDIRAYVLAPSTGTLGEEIRGLIFSPFVVASGEIRGYMQVPDIFETIRGGLNLNALVTTESIRGFLYAIDTQGQIRGLIFRPNASLEDIRGFTHGFDTPTETLRGFEKDPFLPTSGEMRGYEATHAELTETFRGYLPAMLDLSTENIKGYASGVLGFVNENIRGYLTAMTDNSTESIRGWEGVIISSSGEIQGFEVGF